MDLVKRRLMNKISNRFKKKLKGRMVFKLDDAKIGIEYMYGGRWHVKHKRNGEKARTLNMTATLEQTAKYILEETHKKENRLLHNIKARL